MRMRVVMAAVALTAVAGCGGNDGSEVRTAPAAAAKEAEAPAATYTRRFVRTTDTGITARLYEGPVGLVVELSSEAAVASEVVSFGPLDEGLSVLGAGTLGEAEGSPARWVLVASDATEVRARFAGGPLDEMGPVGGVALLAAPGAGGGTVEAVGPDGEVVDAADLDAAPTLPPGVPPTPTTTVPEPTGPPPEDPAAAEAAVRDVFSRAFTGGEDSLDLTAVEDGDEVEVAQALSAATMNFTEAVRTAQVTVSEVGFLDADTATVRYEITYTGGLEFGPQDDGRAELIDGTWLVDRETFCMVMGWAGGQC